MPFPGMGLCVEVGQPPGPTEHHYSVSPGVRQTLQTLEVCTSSGVRKGAVALWAAPLEHTCPEACQLFLLLRSIFNWYPPA